MCYKSTDQMESELKSAFYKILKQTTDKQDTLADHALQNLVREIPGLKPLVKHFQKKKKEDAANGQDVLGGDDVVTAEEDYVRTMLAPTPSFQAEMKEHGGDVDGDGHISQHEVDIYRQVGVAWYFFLGCILLTCRSLTCFLFKY